MSRPKGSKNKIVKDSTKKNQSVPSNCAFPIKVIFKCLGRIYHSEGETIEDALDKIEISGGIKAVGVLTIEHNGIKRERIISGRYANKLFGQLGPIHKMIGLKWVKQLFDL